MAAAVLLASITSYALSADTAVIVVTVLSSVGGDAALAAAAVTGALSATTAAAALAVVTNAVNVDQWNYQSYCLFYNTMDSTIDSNNYSIPINKTDNRTIDCSVDNAIGLIARYYYQ